MDPVPSPAGVRSFDQAQLLVPFPVHEIGIPEEKVEVRSGTAERWSTVRSERSLGAVRFAVKQYAMDWLGHFSAPNKLYSTRTGRWALYGPTRQVLVQPGNLLPRTRLDGTRSGLAHDISDARRGPRAGRGPRP